MCPFSFEGPASEFPGLVNLWALKAEPRDLHDTFVINSQFMEEREFGFDEIVLINFDGPESIEEHLLIRRAHV